MHSDKPPIGQILGWLGLNYSFYFSNNSMRYVLNREDNWLMKTSLNVKQRLQWLGRRHWSQKSIGLIKSCIWVFLTSYRKIWTTKKSYRKYFDQPSRTHRDPKSHVPVTWLGCVGEDRKKNKQPFEKCGNKWVKLKIIMLHVLQTYVLYINTSFKAGGMKGRK